MILAHDLRISSGISDHGDTFALSPLLRHNHIPVSHPITSTSPHLRLTLWDVSISFNHSLYYSMSKGKCEVVTRECLVTKLNGKESNA